MKFVRCWYRTCNLGVRLIVRSERGTSKCLAHFLLRTAKDQYASGYMVVTSTSRTSLNHNPLALAATHNSSYNIFGYL